MKENAESSGLNRNGGASAGTGGRSAVSEKLLKYKKQGCIVPPLALIKTEEQLAGIRASGLVNIAVLDYVAQNIRCGMSTEDINRLVHTKTIELGGVPAPLGFEGFPKSVCTSINEQVCHGIPSPSDILQEGDIINVDVSTIYKGYYSDSSRMFCIGGTEGKIKKLVETAKACIRVGLEQIKPWHPIGDIGYAIHSYAVKHGYSVVREIGGHGTGLAFHEDPFVSYVSKKGSGLLMVPGMVFTIEPMLNMGKNSIYIDSGNGWTVYTEDGLPSAQWEVTAAVTQEGYEILAY